MTDGPPGPTGPTGPHPPETGRPRLSVVVPAYGEERRIAETLKRIRTDLAALLGIERAGGDAFEIVVVDDGSPDGTASAAQAAGADRVIRLPTNRGKGAAVRAGALAATGSAVVFTDADLAYAPSQIARLLDEIEKGWDVVVGNRTFGAGAGSSGLRRAGHRVFNAATRIVLRRRFGDTQCGCKGFHGPAARRIFSRARVDRFAFDVEVLWLASDLGLQIEEVGVQLDGREGSTVQFGLDALRMMRDLLRIRWWIATGAYRRAE